MGILISIVLDTVLDLFEWTVGWAWAYLVDVKSSAFKRWTEIWGTFF